MSLRVSRNSSSSVTALLLIMCSLLTTALCFRSSLGLCALFMPFRRSQLTTAKQNAQRKKNPPYQGHCDERLTANEVRRPVNSPAAVVGESFTCVSGRLPNGRLYSFDAFNGLFREHASLVPRNAERPLIARSA